MLPIGDDSTLFVANPQSADPAAPSCYEKLWNYATQYTELGCGTQRAYYQIAPNPAAVAGPAAAPYQPSQSGSQDNNSDADDSGQNIDGNQNTQITGSNNVINYGSDDSDHDNDGGHDDGKDGGGGIVQVLLVDVYLAVVLSILATFSA